LLFVDISVLPLHAEYLRLGPDELLRLAMARHTPLHLKRVLLIDRGHVVDLAVTRRAADTLRHVNAVIEVNEFREVVDTLSLDRLVLTETRAHRFQIRTVVPQLAVAVHAGLRRRHSRGGRGFDRLMTISAIDAVIADVMFVAELNGLLFFEITTRDI